MNNDEFRTLSEAEISSLFDEARAKSEFNFVLSLNPEFRGMKDAGWSPAEESLRAIEDFSSFLQMNIPERLKVRAALGFYCNLCETSGLFETPKNMLRILTGEEHNCWPFQNLVTEHNQTGQLIAPNANKVMKNLIGHAKSVGRNELALVFEHAFDANLRHAYAHADYVIWSDGIRVCGKNFTQKRIISFFEFQELVNRAAGFLVLIQKTIAFHVHSYSTPALIEGGFSRQEGAKSKVSFDKKNGAFRIESAA